MTTSKQDTDSVNLLSLWISEKNWNTIVASERRRLKRGNLSPDDDFLSAYKFWMAAYCSFWESKGAHEFAARMMTERD